MSKAGLKVSDVLILVGGLLTEILAFLGVLILLSEILVANPLALVGILALVGAISVILIVLKETLPTILDALGKFITQIAPPVIALIRTIGDIINEIILNLGKVLPPIIRSVGKIFETVFDGIERVVRAVGNVIVNVLGGIKGIIKQIGDTVEQILGAVGDLIEKISDTKTPQGIMLIVRQKKFSIEEVLSQKLIVALDAIHDAGNLGTILRTAEAFGCGVIILEDSADVFNSKVVRSSMGAIFFLPTVKMTRAEFLSAMKNFDVKILAAALDSTAEIYYKHDFTKKSAVVFGSEAAGVSQEILDAAKKIYIPMTGRAESLNVATAAAIIISEFIKRY